MEPTQQNLFQRAQEIFLDCIELPPDQRQLFLDRACQGDEHLLRAAQELVQSHTDDTDDWDADRTCEGDVPAITKPPPGIQPGSELGRYRILHPIGIGGMGSVYEAEQDRPQRRVALKVMRHDCFRSESAIRRFEYESQILARMHHPGIAQVYDAGMLNHEDTEIPFIAMELIDGAQSITEYADTEKLSMHQRLRLFIKVCSAVQHGHAMGVIHRDLKPGNILVGDPSRGASAESGPNFGSSETEGNSNAHQVLEAAQPKIIDFGIARVTDSDITTATMGTSVGQIIGTITYMSPEQCSGDPQQLDTRSDVYSLGVLLYQLLTGSLPYQFDNRMLHESLRVIQEEPPKQLSSVNRIYRGDLEIIIGKALEKDKVRRYQTANDLATDIQRFLSDEPIIARPPSAIYQIRKFAKRHKALVASACLMVLMLVTAVAVITPLYFAAERARAEEADARKQADESRIAAELEVVRQDSVIEFFTTMLKSADPYKTRGEKVTVKEMLDAASADVAVKLSERPKVRATIERAIGSTYHTLGSVDKAAEHIDRALELHRTTMQDDPLRLAGMLVMAAGSRRVRGQLDESQTLLEEALGLLEQVDEPTSIQKKNKIQSAAHYYRGAIRFRFGDLENALSDFKESFALSQDYQDDDPNDVASAALAIADVHNALADDQGAIRWYDRAIELQKQKAGDETPELAIIYTNYATLLHNTGELDRAEAMIRNALRIKRQVFQGTDRSLSIALVILADILTDQGKTEEAINAYEDALAADVSSFGKQHPNYIVNNWHYGRALIQSGRMDDGTSRVVESVELANRTFGADQPMTRKLIQDICSALIRLQAHDLCEQVLVEQLAVVGNDDAQLNSLLEKLRQAQNDRDEPADDLF